MKQKKRLLWHLFPSYLLIILLAVIASSWFASNNSKHIVMDQTSGELASIALLVSKQFIPLLDPPQTDAINTLCKDIPKGSTIRITVVLADGTVAGDSDENPSHMDNHANRPELIEAFAGRKGQSVRYSATLQQRMMYLALPLSIQGQTVAAIRTALSLSHIDEAIGTIKYKIVLVGIVIALASTLLGLLISRKITQPIEKMTAAAADFARGDLSQQVPLSNYREIATLGTTLNDMAVQLDNRIRTIISQRNEQEAVLSSMVEGVMAVDRNERVISINQAAIQIFDRTDDMIQNRSVHEIVRNPDLICFVREALATQEILSGDIVIHRADEKILFARSTPLLDSRSEPIGILLVFNDVTQLRQLENMRKNFAANVSHEIKTPLTAIKGFVETLRHGSVQEISEQQRFLKIIERHVNRLTAIIEDLMRLSRIEKENETSQLRFEKRTVKEIALATVALYRDKAMEKEVSIEIECDDAPQLLIDPNLMEQAFFNLLDNAIKYSNKKSRVQISTEWEQDQTLQIHFIDEGIGIPQKHIERLFERFYRVEKARSRKLGGTGLGLAIVKHIISAHNGQITVTSTPQQGSTFTLHLPLTT